MFHTGRCGSTVLANLIDQNPMIFWDGEEYEKLRKSAMPRRLLTVDILKIINLRCFFARKFYGFEIKLIKKRKCLYNQIKSKLPFFVTKLKQAGFAHFIVLYRKNFLRQIVSGAIGFKTQKWQQRSSQPAVKTKLHMDINNVPYGYNSKPLISRFQEFEATYALLDELLKDQKVLWISYEDDILSDPFSGYLQVCRFLDIEVNKAKVRLGRMNPFPLSDIISNYEEIEYELLDTEYEWMLFDPNYE